MPLNRSAHDGEDVAAIAAGVRATLLVMLLDLLLPTLLSNFLRAQARAPPAYRCLVWFAKLGTTWRRLTTCATGRSRRTAGTTVFPANGEANNKLYM
jgi:hypothetical protein